MARQGTDDQERVTASGRNRGERVPEIMEPARHGGAGPPMPIQRPTRWAPGFSPGQTYSSPSILGVSPNT